MKTVSIQEFLQSDDCQQTFNFILNEAIPATSNSMLERNPDVELIKNDKPDPLHYINRFHVPFIDIPIDGALIKNNKIYNDIETLEYSANCLIKSLFIRKFWIGPRRKHDLMVDFVWNNYKAGQHNNEFDRLEEKARKVFDSVDTVYEFNKNFIYNPEYFLMTQEDIIENFEELIKNDVLTNTRREGHLYKLNDENINCTSCCKLDIHPTIMNSMFYVKFYEKLTRCKSKFNYIPSPAYATLNECASIINGKFLFMKHPTNQYLFNTQLLYFY